MHCVVLSLFAFRKACILSTVKLEQVINTSKVQTFYEISTTTSKPKQTEEMLLGEDSSTDTDSETFHYNSGTIVFNSQPEISVDQ